MVGPCSSPAVQTAPLVRRCLLWRCHTHHPWTHAACAVRVSHTCTHQELSRTRPKIRRTWTAPLHPTGPSGTGLNSAGSQAPECLDDTPSLGKLVRLSPLVSR